MLRKSFNAIINMFQRLVAIPQEEYLQLTAVQQARNPITQQFTQLEKRYQQDEHLTEPYKRLVHQSEALDEMKELKEKMRQGIQTATPKPYQSRARTLYQTLEPFLKFNERGEIYNEQNQVVPQSRLEDLIQYAVRDRRRNISPEGWSDFRQLLRSHNVPKYTLNRDTLEELGKQETLKVKKDEDVKKEEITPRKEKKLDITPKPTRLRKPNPKYNDGFGFLKHY